MDAATKQYITSQTFYAEGRVEKVIEKIEASMRSTATRGEIVQALREVFRHTGNIRKKIEFGGL